MPPRGHAHFFASFAGAVRPRIALTLAILVSLLIPSCTFPLLPMTLPWKLSDIQPEPGGVPGSIHRNLTITEHSYDRIWTAAIMVAHEHFEIRQQDRSQGVIRAVRTSPVEYGEAGIGIFIIPAGAGANIYVIEAVSIPRLFPDPSTQNWAAKVLRDLQHVLTANVYAPDVQSQPNAVE